jgi:hypothetical protein
MGTLRGYPQCATTRTLIFCPHGYQRRCLRLLALISSAGAGLSASGLSVGTTSGAVTGTANGTSVTLQTASQTLAGSLSASGLTLNIPQADGSLMPLLFVPSTIAAYNQAVATLQGQAAAASSSAAAASANAAARVSGRIAECCRCVGSSIRVELVPEANAACFAGLRSNRARSSALVAKFVNAANHVHLPTGRGLR